MAVNWDKLNVGRIDLDHSEGFFDKRHLEHERLEDLLQEKLMIVKGKNDEIAAKGLAHTKKANKENVLPITDEKLAQKQVQATVKSMQKLAQGMPLRSQRQTVLTTVVGSRLMNYGNVYEQHKKDLAQKKKQEEETKIIKPFKARPAPKFIRAKYATQETKSVKDVPAPAKTNPKPKPPVALVAPIRRTTPTEASTKPCATTREKPKRDILIKKRAFIPSVARKSVAIQLKNPVSASKSIHKPEVKKFFAKQYLHREPFKVKLSEKKRLTEFKPFKLSIAARIDDRHKSDAERRKVVEERNKKLMAEKQKKDLQEIKVLRKLREFRASVNPFNKVTVVKKPCPTPIEESKEA